MLLLFLVGIVISVGVMSQLMPTQMSSDELGKRELIPWSLSSHLPSDGHDDLFTFRCYAILRYFATDGYRFYVFAPLSVALGQLHLSRSCSVTFAGACMSSCLNFHLIQIFIVLRLQPVLSGFSNLKAGATGLYVLLCDPWCMEVRTFSTAVAISLTCRVTPAMRRWLCR